MDSLLELKVLGECLLSRLSFFGVILTKFHDLGTIDKIIQVFKHISKFKKEFFLVSRHCLNCFVDFAFSKMSICNFADHLKAEYWHQITDGIFNTKCPKRMTRDQSWDQCSNYVLLFTDLRSDSMY